MDRVVSESAVRSTLAGCGFEAALTIPTAGNLEAVFDQRDRASRPKHVDSDGHVWEVFTHGWIADLQVQSDRHPGRVLVLICKQCEEFAVLDREGYTAFDRRLRQIVAVKG